MITKIGPVHAELENIELWSNENRMFLNKDKTYEMIVKCVRSKNVRERIIVDQLSWTWQTDMGSGLEPGEGSSYMKEQFFFTFMAKCW